jgi:hypothetical protein
MPDLRAGRSMGGPATVPSHFFLVVGPNFSRTLRSRSLPKMNEFLAARVVEARRVALSRDLQPADA